VVILAMMIALLKIGASGWMQMGREQRRKAKVKVVEALTMSVRSGVLLT
jgi:hypothetical protein